MDNKKIEDLRKIISEATPLEKWEGSGNYPFYVTIKPPVPSLSKHEGTSKSYYMWRYQDGVYLLTAVHELPKALDEIERLQKENKALYEVNIKLQEEVQEWKNNYKALALATGNQ